MASFNLPYTLSAEDSLVFQGLQASALMHELSKPGEGELVELYKAKKRDEQKKIVEPYADILEEELTHMLQKRKDEILKQLRESKDTSFSVDLFAWKTVLYSETLSELKARESTMTMDELMEHRVKQGSQRLAIMDNKWETMFSVDEEAYNGWEVETVNIYTPIKVERIFKNLAGLSCQSGMLLEVRVTGCGGPGAPLSAESGLRPGRRGRQSHARSAGRPATYRPRRHRPATGPSRPHKSPGSCCRCAAPPRCCWA